MEAAKREALILQFVPMTYRLADRYRLQGFGAGHELEDLAGEGRLALIRAIDDYDPTRGAKLSTHVYNRIRDAIRHYVRDQNGLVKMSRNRWERGDRLTFTPLFDTHMPPANEPSLDGILLHDALSALPVYQQAVIRLHILEGIPLKVLGAQIGRSGSALGVGMHRGLARMRKRLEPLGYG